MPHLFQAQKAASVSRLTAPQKGAVAGLTAALIWGAYLSLSRAGVTSGLDGIDIAFLRYAVAAPVMLVWILLKRNNPLATVRPHQALTVAVLLGPPFVLLSVGGYAFAPLAHGAVILPATLTLGGFILARLFLGERLEQRRTYGAAAILTGLLFVAGPGILAGSAVAFFGDILFVTAGFFWAGFSVLQQRWKLNAIDVTALVSIVGFLAVIPAYLWLRGVSSLVDVSTSMLVTQVIVQGVLSGVVAMIAFAQAVKFLGAAGAATFPALVPGFALLIGIPLTGEVPSSFQLIGLLIVATGLAIALGKPKDKRNKSLEKAYQ